MVEFKSPASIMWQPGKFYLKKANVYLRSWICFGLSDYLEVKCGEINMRLYKNWITVSLFKFNSFIYSSLNFRGCVWPEASKLILFVSLVFYCKRLRNFPNFYSLYLIKIILPDESYFESNFTDFTIRYWF